MSKVEIIREAQEVEASGYASITELAQLLGIDRDKVSRCRSFENTYREGGITYIPLETYNVSIANKLKMNVRFKRMVSEVISEVRQ